MADNHVGPWQLQLHTASMCLHDCYSMMHGPIMLFLCQVLGIPEWQHSSCARPAALS